MNSFFHLVASALAQDNAAAAPSGSTAAVMNFLPFALILGVFYLLVIRPQQKKYEEQNRMVKALQRGDRVITSGGLHGKIARIESDDHVMLEIADGVVVKVQRNQIQGLASKPVPVTGDAPKDEG